MSNYNLILKMSAGGYTSGQQINRYCQNEGAGTITCNLMFYGTYLLYGIIFLVFIWKVILRKTKKVNGGFPLKVNPHSGNKFVSNYLFWAKSHLAFSLVLPLVFALLFCVGSISAFLIILLVFSIVFYFLKRETKTG